MDSTVIVAATPQIDAYFCLKQQQILTTQKQCCSICIISYKDTSKYTFHNNNVDLGHIVMDATTLQADIYFQFSLTAYFGLNNLK